MKEIVVNGKKFISTKRAAEITGYTTDYVGQLARSGKVVAQLVGRNWYVDEESIKQHKFGALSSAVHSVDEEPAAPELEVLIEEKEEEITEKDPEPTTSKKEENGKSFISDTVSEMQDVWSSWYAAQEIKDENDSIVLSDEELRSLEDIEEEVPIQIEEEVEIKREDVSSTPTLEEEEETVPPSEPIISPYQEEVAQRDRSSLLVGTLALLLLVGLVVVGGFVVLRNDVASPASVLVGIEQYFSGVTEFQR